MESRIAGTRGERGVSILQLLFVLLMAGLCAYYFLYPGFRGLSSKYGIDQAQIARSLQRDQGFVTKNIRPFSIWQMEKNAKDFDFDPHRFPDTFHPPLNPILNSILLGFVPDRLDYKMPLTPAELKGFRERSPLPFLADRTIVMLSMLLFLCACLVNFFLIRRLFDTRVGFLSTLTMLLSLVFWEQTQSGLPFALNHLLFALGVYFLLLAYECDKTLPITKALFFTFISGVFFGLMVLAAWVNLAMVLGMSIFTFLFFKQRRVLGFVLLIAAIVVFIYPMQRNFALTGNFFGSFGGVISLRANLGHDGAVFGVYNYETSSLVDYGVLRVVSDNIINILQKLPTYFGLNIAVMAFFVSCFHQFVRPATATFRWGLLISMFLALLGMGLLGERDGTIDLNQSLTYFTPIFTAYGLAFILMMFKRLKFAQMHNQWFITPSIVIVAIAAIPLLLKISFRLELLMRLDYIIPQKLYDPRSISLLRIVAKEKEIICSDAPELSAWYGDRCSLLLPINQENFEALNDKINDTNNEVLGILFTPISLDLGLVDVRILDHTKNWAVYFESIFNNKKPSMASEFHFMLPFSYKHILITHTDRSRLRVREK